MGFGTFLQAFRANSLLGVAGSGQPHHNKTGNHIVDSNRLCWSALGLDFIYVSEISGTLPTMQLFTDNREIKPESGEL